MELPQPHPFGAEGRKATHDFLSLYSHSTVQQDPRPPSQGEYLKTHDFLKPLERTGAPTAKEEAPVEISALEKPPPPATSPAGEHILPGGIGTYSISHISYFNPRVPKPEGAIFTVAQGSSTDRNDENSNCSSYTGSGFTLWEEPAAKKGKTGKENGVPERSIATEPAATKSGQWTPERPSHSSSNNNNHRSSLSAVSSSQTSGQKSQSLMEMIKSAKDSTHEEENDDDEDFVPKKEYQTTATTLKGELSVKVDGKSHDQKPNTPRSKHSATEQRRRSKINDRFQKLRELIPHGDQKRDKASFLLEVIEYIQFLQERVQRYEGSYQGWNHEAAKLIPWKNNHRPPENYADQSRAVTTASNPALMFAANLDEKNAGVCPAVPGVIKNHMDSDISSASTFKAINHHCEITNKTAPFPLSLQPHTFAHISNPLAHLSARLVSHATQNTASQPQSHLRQTRPTAMDGSDSSHKMKEQDLSVEGGTISISSVYSQGLLNTLTEALRSSGVDLSQASISVQIELGKEVNGKGNVPTSIVKDNEFPSSNQRTKRSRDVKCEESDQALKKINRGRS